MIRCQPIPCPIMQSLLYCAGDTAVSSLACHIFDAVLISSGIHKTAVLLVYEGQNRSLTPDIYTQLCRISYINCGRLLTCDTSMVFVSSQRTAADGSGFTCMILQSVACHWHALSCHETIICIVPHARRKRVRAYFFLAIASQQVTVQYS